MPLDINGQGSISGITSLNTVVSDAELERLDGVTSPIQTQINTAGGLVKILDQSFTSASAVSVNNCFSSTYKRYLLLWDATTNTAGVDIQIRWRASGSDNSTANSYTRQVLRIDGSSVTASRTTTDLSRIGNINSTANSSGMVNVHNVFLSTSTNFYTNQLSSGSGAFMDLYSSTHNQNVSYDGFTISLSTGNFTGSVSVYGYRD